MGLFGPDKNENKDNDKDNDDKDQEKGHSSGFTLSMTKDEGDRFLSLLGGSRGRPDWM